MILRGIILLFITLLLFAMIDARADDGRRIYESTCIRCHNANPTSPGSIGPDLYSTPLSVFRTKVSKGTYPSGYSPKRRTKIMPVFPRLTNSIDSVYKYIRSTQK